MTPARTGLSKGLGAAAVSCLSFAMMFQCEGSSPLSEDVWWGSLLQILPGLAVGQEETPLHLISQFPHPSREHSHSHFL